MNRVRDALKRYANATGVRLSTFFAREHEVRIIDPDRVEFVEQHGCEIELRGAYF